MTATANLPARAPLQSGGQVAAIIPQTIEDAFRVANAFAASGLAPQSLKGPEAILVSIMAGAELGFAPYQAMQSFAVINGRASIWGDAIPALLWSKGFDIEETFDDEDEPTKAICVVTRPGGKSVRRTFSLKDAKDAGLLDKQGPWKTARKRMLQMRARAFAARDGAADVLRGMPVYEEVADYTEIVRDVTPRPTGMRARLEARAASAEGFSAEHVARETGAASGHDEDGVVDEEITDAEILAEAEAEETFPGDQPRADAQEPATAEEATRTETTTRLTLSGRVAGYKAEVTSAATADAIRALRKRAEQLFRDVDAGDPDEIGITAKGLGRWTDDQITGREEAERDQGAA